jgi:leucyl aminopeptidase
MLEIKATNPARFAVDILAVAVAENAVLNTDPAIVALVERAKGFAEFTAEKDQELLLHAPAELTARRVLLVGLGKAKEIDAESLRRLAATLVNRAIAAHLSKAALLLPEATHLPLEFSPAVDAMLEGACLSNHVFSRYKKEEKEKTG